ncbi:MAG: ATP-binding protein [Thermodesulfobacteriota bacterium]|nr:ATP-binding protein [Thermodesulfobacteriota bacterium]
MKDRQRIYPFTAIVGQEKMKLALILNIINPTLSGVLIRGEKGTAKSTAVRALADILPEIEVFENDPFQLSPANESEVYLEFMRAAYGKEISLQEPVKKMKRKVRVVELPVGATEDRVAGTMDLEHALQKGEKRIEPGILATAHRGILYVDEVNLLDDHVVDILLDSAAMGVNTIEREGLSFSHPARFTLVGTMNPEEGELRPQLLDRFGLCVIIEGIQDPEDRVTIMERRHAFDMDPDGFCVHWETASKELAEKIDQAAFLYPEVTIERPLLFEIASYCLNVGVDGHRGDIIMLKTAKTLAAYHGRQEVDSQDIETAAGLVLPHRVRRQPLQTIGNDVQSMLEKGFGQ